MRDFGYNAHTTSSETTSAATPLEGVAADMCAIAEVRMTY